jgi:ketosteroid isomerase-like protein
MTGDEFAQLLNDFTLSAESGDGARFASHFAEDAIYHDYIYGPHKGRADIAHMMQNLFHRDAADYRWEMFDPVFDGEMGYSLVAVELQLESPGVRRKACRDRRHQPLHPARRADRRIPRIRQWRRGDGPARGRAGTHE